MGRFMFVFIVGTCITLGLYALIGNEITLNSIFIAALVSIVYQSVGMLIAKARRND